MTHQPHRPQGAIDLAVCLAVGLAVAVSTSACASDEAGYSLTLEVTLNESGDKLDFVTPVGELASLPTEAVVGKPYVIAAFPAGFSPAGDGWFEAQWGVVPAELAVSFTSAPVYADGPYDMVFVVYVDTEITPEMMTPGAVPPAVVAGDLATFTIDLSAARPGDPAIVPGVVRLNVDGADQRLEVENRVPADPDDSAQVAAALTNTVMLVP